MSKWYSFEELKQARAPMPLDSETGLPDNHVITVSERTIRIDGRKLVQNNVSTDTYTLELDAEWDDITPVVIFSNSEGDYKVAYENGPTKIPAAVMAVIGAVDVSVFGLDSTGAVRVVTKAAPNIMNVVASGKFVGEVSEDDVSLLGQILAAVEAANEAAENANATIIKSAVATTLNPGEPATANLADNVLTIGIPKGEKGDKGDPGQDGVTPFTQATVTTLEPGTTATVAIEEDTLKLGIPKGEKGDKGDPGQNGSDGADGVTPFTQATVTTLEPGTPATVAIEEDTLKLGIPKGEKGDKGDPGQDGVTPFTQATVTTLEPGVPATVTIEEDTLKLGVPKGEKGDKGDQGDKGEKGDQGDKGDPGTAATISVGSVTGLDAGASPTVVNSGTANAARFDFGIPKGDKGDTGDPGHTPQRGVDYWTAEDVDAVVEDAKAQAVAELAEIGNVPKRTVTDLVAHAKDAYAQKPIEVRIKGKTWVNRWPKFTETTTTGVTITCDETGLFTLSGTATSLTFFSTPVNGLAAGRKVILSKSGGTGFTAFLTVGSNSQNTTVSVSTSNTSTGTIASDATNFNAHIRVESGSTVNTSFRVMLVEGSEAPDCFTPPASITSVQTGNLVTAGKNLLNEIIIKNTSAGYAACIYAKGIPRNVDVTLTFDCNPDNRFYISEYATQQYTPVTVSGGKASATFKLRTYIEQSQFNSSGYMVLVKTEGDTTTPTNISNVQLELGSTVAAYEPPNIITTPLPEVELRSLPNGTCDELVIGADGTCRVERKTGVIVLDGSEDEAYGTEGIAAGNGVVRISYNNDTGLAASISGGAVSNLYPNVFTWDNAGFAISLNNDGLVYFNDVNCQTIDSLRQKLRATPMTIIGVLRESTTEPQSPVALPALPAPTFNQYHDSDVPSDTSTTYTRDINIALANLEAQIADLVTKEAANV